MITIDSLTVRYGQKTVLDRLTMHLAEGAVHGLAGINGAGKTTLFETLFGLVRPAAGSITRFGRPCGAARSPTCPPRASSTTA